LIFFLDKRCLHRFCKSGLQARTPVTQLPGHVPLATTAQPFISSLRFCHYQGGVRRVVFVSVLFLAGRCDTINVYFIAVMNKKGKRRLLIFVGGEIFE
jgi:hypothetical protein